MLSTAPASSSCSPRCPCFPSSLLLTINLLAGRKSDQGKRCPLRELLTRMSLFMSMVRL